MSLVTSPKLNSLWQQEIPPLRIAVKQAAEDSVELLQSPHNAHKILDRWGEEMPQRSNLLFINRNGHDKPIRDTTVIGDYIKSNVFIPTYVDFVYNTHEQSIDIPWGAIVISGQTSAINAGEYSVTLGISDEEMFQWSDGTTEEKEFTWRIKKKQVKHPDFQNLQTFIFDKTIKYPQLSEYDAIAVQVTGITSARNASSYEVVYSLKDKQNYEWED